MATYATDTINHISNIQRGINKREYFATLALNGLLSNLEATVEDNCKLAVECADLLIEELNK